MVRSTCSCYEKERRAFETSMPKSLLNAVFYFNGKNFWLRGDEEHFCLAISQIVRQQHPDQYDYTKRIIA